MKFLNTQTSKTIEIPKPNELGESVLLLNGEFSELLFFSDLAGGTVTTGDGRKFKAGRDFTDYVISRIG